MLFYLIQKKKYPPPIPHTPKKKYLVVNMMYLVINQITVTCNLLPTDTVNV